MKMLYVPDCYSQQRQREKPANIYPVRMAMEAEWHRRNGDTVHWGKAYPRDYEYYDIVTSEPEGLPFLSLPPPDREFTNAKHHTSGNYKYLPGTHIQVADGCWWGKCTFCVENGRPYVIRSVDECIAEIEECKHLGFKEVFDDSGTFPVGKWMQEFCRKVTPLGIHLGANMRCVDTDYLAMRRAGFRMLLFGIESANQETLDRIGKGTKVEDVKYIITAAKEGIGCHIAVMFSYPWESDEDAERTLRLVHYLLRKGYAKTAQASFYDVGDTNHNHSHKRFIPRIYDIYKYPEFWFNKLKDIRNTDDIKYLWRQIKEGLCQKLRY